MENSARRLEMPVFPKERFVEAITKTVAANAAYVPPFGSGATLYVRPYTVSYTHLWKMRGLSPLQRNFSSGMSREEMRDITETRLSA